MVTNREGVREAQFYEKLAGGKVRCALCSHSCTIGDGKRGICGVRENRKGTLHTLAYGLAPWAAPQADPIEKKPLYHFFPGTLVASFGTVGCNLRCMQCQNHHMSQAAIDSVRLREVDLGRLMDDIKKSSCKGVAWTYNEPTIWYEFTYDGSVEAKKRGLYTVYVTNGFIQEAPLRKIAPYLDAMNIDVKGFTEDFYRKVCSAKLAPVMRTCELAIELGIHIELTNLIIPGKNDDMGDIERMCEWVRDKLGPKTVMHFSRFHPDYKLEDVPATPLATLDAAGRLARKVGLKYVYVGNVNHPEFRDTTCANCGATVISREGMFGVSPSGLKGGSCAKCGEKIVRC